MLCQNCNDNEANVKYTQIINGVKKQMNLCDECARKLGIDGVTFNMPINFSNFLEDFWEDTSSFMPPLLKQNKLVCSNCNTSYDDFIQNGMFGCEDCYETFGLKLDSLLKNIHGVNRHIGRNGRLLGKTNENKVEENKEKITTKQSSELEKLKARLKQEIKEERYEDAAKTRDEIKKLESKS